MTEDYSGFESVSTFFKNLNDQTILIIAEEIYGQPEEDEAPSVSKLRTFLADSAKATGVDFVLNKCTKPILMQLESESANGMSGGTKPSLIEDLGKQIDKLGFRAFLESKGEAVLHDVALKNKLVQKDGDEDKDTLVDLIVREMEIRGVQKIMDCFSAPKLKELCKTAELEIDTMSKKRLIHTFITGEDPGAKPVQGGIRSKSSDPNRPPLEPGISWLDIYNYYTLRDIHAYFQDHDIEMINGDKGKKVDVLFEHLNPGETPIRYEERGFDDSSDMSEVESEFDSAEEFNPDNEDFTQDLEMDLKLEADLVAEEKYGKESKKKKSSSNKKNKKRKRKSSKSKTPKKKRRVSKNRK